MKIEDGIKFDNDKVRWDLIPFEFIEEIAKVYTFGAQKYKANSWQKVENAEERYFAALMRHISEYRKGNGDDEESGLSHLDHAIANLAMLIEYEEHFPQGDDRFKR